MSRPAYRILAPDLLAAIFDRLAEECADLRVGDDLPDPAFPPFVVLGEFEQDSEATKSSSGARISARLEVYSQAAGFLEASTIADRVVEAITKAPLVSPTAQFSAASAPYASGRRAQHTSTGEIYRQVSLRFEFLVARRKA